MRALLEVLGDREPLEVLAELVPWLETRLREVDPRGARAARGAGKWSVIEVVQHLADSELVLGFRVRMILSEDRPPLQGYDQDRWATLFRYARRAPGSGAGAAAGAARLPTSRC